MARIARIRGFGEQSLSGGGIMVVFNLVSRSRCFLVREPLLSAILCLCICSGIFWLDNFACNQLQHNWLRLIVSMQFMHVMHGIDAANGRPRTPGECW
jgi:hypothetical protein